MAKALLIETTGKPEVLKDMDINFRAPRQNEVVIKHTAIGVNRLDIDQRSGLYNLRDNVKKLKFPAIVGCSGVGVVKVLSDATQQDLRVGDRVCYVLPYGSYSEERIVDMKYLHKIPSEISDVDVAATLYNGLLSYFMTTRAHYILGDTVVMVQGVDTDAGNMLVQWINARVPSCKIIGTVSSANDMHSSMHSRCALLLDYSQDVDFLSGQVMNFTGGRGVSAVFDCIGRDTYLLSLNSVSPFGSYVLYEQRSGEIPPISWKTFRARSSFFTYPSLFHYTRNIIDGVFGVAEVFHFLKKKMIRPESLTKYSGLSEVIRAHKEIEANRLKGPVVVTL